jgi:hypothetical protein
MMCGGINAYVHTFLTSALDGSGQLHATTALPVGEKATPPPGTHWIKEWVDHKDGLEAVEYMESSWPYRKLKPCCPDRSQTVRAIAALGI